MTFHVKKEDANYIIFSIKGMKDYPNKLDQCLEKKKDVVKEIEDNFELKNKYTYTDDYAGAAGKSIAYITDFDLLDGGTVRIWCAKWDKKNEKSKYWIDTLNIGINSKQFFDWLNSEAYK